MKQTILLFVLLATLSSCTDEDKSKEVLEDAGYKDIQFTGYSPFSCGDDYTYATGFEATAINGRHVKGVVCGGILKGSTIKIK